MRSFAILTFVAMASACAPAATPAPQPAYPNQPPPYGYPQAPYPPQQQGDPQAQTYPQQQPHPQPTPQAQPQAQPMPQAQPQPLGPLLAPIAGSAAWQAETRGVLGELIARLSPDNQAKVRGIPMTFDPNPFEINAYAGCDERGAPFIAGTEGLLEAVDAIAQTKATDDLYGTHTYDAYIASVTPMLAQSDKASAALPPGIIAPNVYSDPRRLSHAREWFDDLVAFTFGHELSHHYLGHTMCAIGVSPDNQFAPFVAFEKLSQVIPAFNQPNEIAADNAGVVNMLDAGRARVPAYRWSERGAYQLLDFFAKLEQAAGAKPLSLTNFLRSHPPAAQRVGWITPAVRLWYLQHPG